MKFGKEFQSQMVPEWQDAYMDYSSLKSILKDVIRFRQPPPPTPQHHVPSDTSGPTPIRRRESLYRAFSGLTSRYGGRNSPRKREEDEVILVSSVSSDEVGGGGRYQTMFLKSTEEGGEYELVFFRRLDDEFNKVVKFYKDKVADLATEADELSRQMNALIALRIKVEKPVVVFGHSVADVSAPAAASSRRSPGSTRLSAIQEVEMSGEEQTDEAVNGDRNGTRRPSPLHVSNDVKIKVGPETPILMGSVLMGQNMSFSKSELRKAEDKMTNAFVEFHERLRLLKNYCFLNHLAFSKIMKKYDKITSRNASKAYLKMVDDSYLGSSDEVNKLIEKVEHVFVKHFANGNRRKGMKTLRPTAKRERHRITFMLGSFTGFAIALIVAIIVVVHARGLLPKGEDGKDEHEAYMNNIFPLYSFFGYIVLHLIMYASNIYFWKRYRINYPFIFGFKQGTELGYREVLLLGSGLAVMMFGGVLSNLDMEMEPKTGNYKALTELVPLALLVLVIVITLCPFNILYRSSRYFLIGVTFHCICAPFYKVILPDFFFADQVTSQVQAIRNLAFYVCYYGWGDFKKRSNKCDESQVYETFYYIVACVPYWIRFLQCVRRLIQEKDRANAYNGIKYLSTIVAIVFRTMFDRNNNKFKALEEKDLVTDALKKQLEVWRITSASTSAFATVINTYWDIVVDWGLLRRNSKNPWLRDKLVIPNKSVYFIAMVVNVILRLVWMQVVLGISTLPLLHRQGIVVVVASLEIIRRGIWNFFRLENEHLNNVGKYRAFKSVPLPFQHGEYKNI